MVICNPGSIVKDVVEMEIAGRPYFLVLDSLGETHSDAVAKLREYLRKEYHARKGRAVHFGVESMGVRTPEVPQQENSCDCGVYLLHYVEMVFKVRTKWGGGGGEKKSPNVNGRWCVVSL